MLDSRFSTQVTQNEGDWILLKKNLLSLVDCILVAQRLGRRTFDQVVMGSIPGRGVINQST